MGRGLGSSDTTTHRVDGGPVPEERSSTPPAPPASCSDPRVVRKPNHVGHSPSVVASPVTRYVGYDPRTVGLQGAEPPYILASKVPVPYSRGLYLETLVLPDLSSEKSPGVPTRKVWPASPTTRHPSPGARHPPPSPRRPLPPLRPHVASPRPPVSRHLKPSATRLQNTVPTPVFPNPDCDRTKGKDRARVGDTSLDRKGQRSTATSEARMTRDTTLQGGLKVCRTRE